MITTKVPRRQRREGVRRRLERWRRTRAHPRSPIPDAVWAGAVTLVREHGLYRTARTLRVNYGALKQHVEAAAAACARTPPAFVEFAGPPVDLGACVIEVEGPHGTLRIRLPGLAPADVLALSRAVWSGEA